MNFWTFWRLKSTNWTNFRAILELLESRFSKNWFHVKSKWQKNPEISTFFFGKLYDLSSIFQSIFPNFWTWNQDCKKFHSLLGVWNNGFDTTLQLYLICLSKWYSSNWPCSEITQAEKRDTKKKLQTSLYDKPEVTFN